MFDATFRLLIDDFPGDWHDWLCAVAGVSRDVPLVELDADLGTVGARADKLYQAGDELLHFEVQLKSERTFPDRSLLYNVQASHRHGGPVRTVLILPRREANASTLTGVLERTLADGTTYLTFHYTVIRLWQLPADSFLNGPLGTLPLAALTDDAEPRLAEVVGRIHERFHAELPPEEANRVEAAAFVLLGLRYNAEDVQRLYEGVQEMEESTTYQYIMRKGAINIARRMVRAAGQKKLGPIPAEVDSALAAIDDTERMERINTAIHSADDWDDLLNTP